MKRLFLISLLLPALLTPQACGKAAPGDRTVQLEMGSTLPATNAAGDAACSFQEITSVSYMTDAGDNGTAEMAEKGRSTISGKISVSGNATKLWCYTPEVNVPAQIVCTESSSAVEGAAFCTPTIVLSKRPAYTAAMRPLTSAVVLDIIDSRDIDSGKEIASVVLEADGNVALAGQPSVIVQESRLGEALNASSSITFQCTGMQVGTSSAPASVAAVVLPCEFVGGITVTGDGFSGRIAIDQPITFQAGYVKHIVVDIDKLRGNGGKGFPKRVGIMGDSISTFEGIIPSDHRKYYPTTGCDVDDWTKTYWGLLITDYWKCELDVNTSWSGSSVAKDKAGSVRTPFVDQSRLDLFQNPDCILLFGGTNDAIATNEIGLGEFCYETPLEEINTSKRFRDAYIYVIRYLQQKHPGVQIICIIGTDVTGDYGTSVEAIAQHYNLPYVDFRDDKVPGKVTIYSGSHPDAAGHAYKARKIYEETLPLFN